MTESSTLVCPQCGTLNRVPADRPALQARCGRCRAALFDGTPAEVDEAGFARHRKHDAIPLLLDVWAPWCGPCRTMAPMFERAAATLEPEVRLLKVNADTAPALTAELNIRGIPTMVLFIGGRPVAQASGARDAAGIVRWVREHLATLGT